ncbi:hypothetical protein TNIN_236371 [Trichonephila inaurata madagascariensis]|uniref:Uncharacterized protein n=1 Tax=Trichonephila inaurata madagascariensis TaxID=2747483 RepID=A0A8X6WW53_9ARAC|nr:hypothetical protein TNIN_236371 [Trichonephila inaurata madagascariensis]
MDERIKCVVVPLKGEALIGPLGAMMRDSPNEVMMTCFLNDVFVLFGSSESIKESYRLTPGWAGVSSLHHWGNF